MELHLVADTNLFFECKALEQLPWHELRHDTVVILLTKPVLDEVDKHKKGAGRTRERAVNLFGRVRAMLAMSVNETEIQLSSPRVLLRRVNNVIPDPELADYLDYTKTDEKLIGITSTLNKEASGYEVKLFTDDTGPATSADGLRVPFLMIDEAWRRPASETNEQKKIRDLEKDLATYRVQEPQVAIVCETADRDNFVRVTQKLAKPLTTVEIEECLVALRVKHPVISDFTPPPTATTIHPSGEVITKEYSAPSEEETARYRDIRYPNWIEQCRAVLQRLHEGRDEIEPSIILEWSMSNKGSRPAAQVRVAFTAEGPLALLRIKESDGNAGRDNTVVSQRMANAPNQLPSPPKPPPFIEHVRRAGPPIVPKTGQSVSLSALREFGSPALSELTKISQQSSAIKTALDAAKLLNHPGSLFGVNHLDALVRPSAATISPMPIVRPLMPLMPERRRPEAFYYDWSARIPVREGILTCDLWRHQTDDEIFKFEVIIDNDGEASGVVRCSVHAENLTRPAQAKVIIQRTIEQIDLRDLANGMVATCS